MWVGTRRVESVPLDDGSGTFEEATQGSVFTAPRVDVIARLSFGPTHQSHIVAAAVWAEMICPLDIFLLDLAIL